MKKWVVYCGVMVILVAPGFAGAQEQQHTEERVTTLKEIVVVATREQDEIVRIPANVSVITEEDIKRSSAKDVADLLRGEAGVMVTNTSGSTPTGITVETRGFNNGGGNGGRTLVLIDGWKANQADSSSADWAIIPLENIDRIEVIRGPATAIYGDSAMAGVINIITKSGKGKPSFEIGADVGNWQRFAERATLHGSTDRLSYFLYGSHAEEDGYRDNSNFRSNDVAGKFSYALTPEVELNLKASYHDDDRELPGALTDDDIETVGRRGSVAASDERELDQFNIGLGADIVPNENNKFSILFHLSNNERDFLISVPGSGTNFLGDEEDDYSLALRYTSTHPVLGKENKAIFGVDLLKEEVASENFANFPDPLFPFIERGSTDYEREILGVYLHDDFSVTDRVILGAGLRFDRAIFEFSNKTTDLDLVVPTTSTTEGSKDFNSLSPKASITYLFTEDISSYFSFAKSFRFPNRDELTGFLGLSPELDPEKGRNFEIGMKARFGQTLNGGLSLYYLTVEDEIIARSPNIGEFAFPENDNIDEVVHKGLELTAETGIIPRTTLFGTYTFTDTEIEKGPFEGSELPITPRHSGSIGAHIDLGHGFSFWNQARFVGERFLANDLPNALDKLPGYGVWDAKLSYAFKAKNYTLSAFFGVNNILDKEYEEFGGVGGFPFGSRVGVNPSPERGYFGGFTLRL